MVLFRCSYTLSICNCCHKVSNILSCDFVTSFSSENEVKSLSKFSPGHSSWSSGLVKRVHFESKTCSIQTESYTFYSRNFAESLQKTFRTNLSISLKSSLVRIFFSEHESISGETFYITLWTAFSLIDGRISAFTIILFTQKFPISSCKCLVCCKIFLFCRTDSFRGLPRLFFSKCITESPIFFFICLQMVAFEYFQHDLTFDVIYL